MPNELIYLCQFYANYYGMIIHTVYNPIDFTIKGYIIFRNTKKNYSIMCAGMTDKEITSHFHLMIYDILAENAINDIRG